jgi:hypothetical protein
MEEVGDVDALMGSEAVLTQKICDTCRRHGLPCAWPKETRKRACTKCALNKTRCMVAGKSTLYGVLLTNKARRCIHSSSTWKIGRIEVLASTGQG